MSIEDQQVNCQFGNEPFQARDPRRGLFEAWDQIGFVRVKSTRGSRSREECQPMAELECFGQPPGGPNSRMVVSQLSDPASRRNGVTNAPWTAWERR